MPIQLACAFHPLVVLSHELSISYPDGHSLADCEELY
jgi:hypothetical protein